MAKSVSTQTELFDVAELPGRPMLHWHGKRPLREIPYYPAQTCERYGLAQLTTSGHLSARETGGAGGGRCFTPGLPKHPPAGTRWCRASTPGRRESTARARWQ